MFLKKIFVFAVVLVVQKGNGLFAQTDTSYPLPPVAVQAASLRDVMTGEKAIRFDSSQLAQSAAMDIGALLALHGNIYIKSYGLGSLSTTSMRGGSASHTAVTWNGVQLQSPMLGLNDVALLPVFLADEVSVHYGSSGAQWGSGAVGGRIALENKRPDAQGWRIGFQGGVGSYDAENVQAKVQYGQQKWATVTRVIYSDASNNFSWKINNTLPEKMQTNAAARQWGILQDLYWNITSRQQIEGHFWQQYNDRQIPPTTTQNKSAARQLDDASRATVQWKYFFSKQSLAIKGAFVAENIDFQDSILKTKALSGFRTRFIETTHKWLPNHWLTIQSGATFTQYHATANGYKDGIGEQRTACFTTVQLNKGDWKVEGDIRQEWVDGRRTPVIPAAGLVWQPLANLHFSAKSTRQYRLPTLNDRYWQPGGNPDLLPESGWSHEAGFVFQPVGGLEYSATVYSRKIKNWILWSQAEGQSYWGSNNITSVWSRGVEQQLRCFIKRGKWSWNVHLQYDYTRSTNEKAIARPQMAAGEQLIYVPVHQGGIGGMVQYKRWLLQYNHRYSGAVKGINAPVKPWNVGLIRGQVSGKIMHCTGSFFIQSDNLWNSNYRIIERRPMPGRNYQTGISIQF